MDVSTSLDLLWVIIAGILVFFMQAGFTLLEAGFTRAKNVANIAMKNIVDLFVGAISFWAIGYTLMYGDSINGFIGSVSFFYMEPTDMHNLFYQTVFCATAATIISGAIAERAKFSTYFIFTFAFTTFIYPIAGHWIWQGDGWLTNMGFIDFAGSTAVHVMGGFAGLVFAFILGPRIGKYNSDGSSNDIPGHNLLQAVTGVFILWLGWFGFNAGSELAITGASANKVAMIIVTTNLAAAGGGLAALLTSWIRKGKANVSMTLNGSLAGLVGVTAGCAAVNPLGGLCIGLISGIVVVFSIDIIDKKLKIDDPVSVGSVHGIVGLIGTILVGVFATENGLLYGGGFELLKIQSIGTISVALWAMTITSILVLILKYTVGIRVTQQEETIGLDETEHNPNYIVKQEETIIKSGDLELSNYEK
ncbi:ammonium transporter [Aquimarina addita]|uniref:Ammonium transporter n=1 Tax=Aquimarina addita TaxID=870485 RepID=A0ABP6UMQ6_9FLAO